MPAAPSALSVAGRLDHIAPEGLFLVGAVSQYLGAVIAIGLFDEIDAATVAWLRVLTAAVILIIVRRTWTRRFTREELGWTAAFGIVLAGMNLAFYLAIDRLPLGNSVAIEFVGPITVAALGARHWRSAAALLLTVGGVGLLAEVTPDASAAGIGLLLVAGTLWAGYIILGHRVARQGLSVDGLGLGMAIGAVAIAPFGAPGVDRAFARPGLLILAALTGLLSNAIPYAIDQRVLARIPRARFALLQALLPVTATGVALVTLGQTPSGLELAGIGLVIVALSIRQPAAPVPDEVSAPG